MVRRLPQDAKCYVCGKKAIVRERDSNRVETGKIICRLCYDLRRRHGTYERPEKVGHPRLRYKIGDICSRCIEEKDVTNKSILRPGNVLQEKDKDGKKTERCVCSKHWKIDYEKYDPNSWSNTVKSIANCRTRCQDPNHSSTKGDIDLDVVCELYGYINLNKKYDNYTTSIDCLDEKTDQLYQVKGSCYNTVYRYWSFGSLENEWKKQYKGMIFVCKSNDGKRIEEIYIIPPEEIKDKRKTIAICKYDSKRRPYTDGWYEKYRIKGIKRQEDIKRANEILQRKLQQRYR